MLQASGQLAEANYDQLDLAASLRAQSLQQEARIKIEERKASLYESTLCVRSPSSTLDRTLSVTHSLIAAHVTCLRPQCRARI